MSERRAIEFGDMAQRVEKLAVDRQAMQLAGTHPAPCARHCEANAFQIEIRGLKAARATAEQERDALAAELDALKSEAADLRTRNAGQARMMAGCYGTPKACDSREIDDLVGLRGCNSRHGGHDTDPCKFLARMSDAGCGGCKYRGVGQASEAGHEND